MRSSTSAQPDVLQPADDESGRLPLTSAVEAGVVVVTALSDAVEAEVQPAMLAVRFVRPGGGAGACSVLAAPARFAPTPSALPSAMGPPCKGCSRGTGRPARARCRVGDVAGRRNS